jgi:ribosomal protein S18 acetylase RimI-like enzyme
MTTVRHATTADADAIGRVQVETWRIAYADLLPQETIDSFDVSARQAMWREGLGRIARPGSATFVALVDDEVVGFATVGASHSEDGAGELYAIYVDPAYWGHGAGRALIERSEASLRESGFPNALLWVIEGNERAERFYRDAGWERDGEEKDVFQGATVTELRYRKRLSPGESRLRRRKGTKRQSLAGL